MNPALKNWTARRGMAALDAVKALRAVADADAMVMALRWCATPEERAVLDAQIAEQDGLLMDALVCCARAKGRAA